MEESICSVLDQDMDDWELLLVNSNADTNSLSLAKKLVASDSRVQLLNASGSGISHALNTGLQVCRSNYIARMDADDRMMPGRLRSQADFLDNTPDVDLVACRCKIFPVTADNEGYRLFVDWQNSLLSPDEHRINRFVESPVAHPAVMFRSELMDRYGGYRSDGVPEDYELWLRWMDAGVRFSKLPEMLMEWRDHAERLSRNHPDYSETAFFRIKAQYFRRWLDKHPGGDRPLIVCGGSRNIQERMALLLEAGILISAYTDVVVRNGNPLPFVPIENLPEPGGAFVISLIGQRGVRDEIRKLLTGRGYREEQDFLMLA